MLIEYDNRAQNSTDKLMTTNLWGDVSYEEGTFQIVLHKEPCEHAGSKFMGANAQMHESSMLVNIWAPRGAICR